MAREFNVSVLLTLKNRVSQGLRTVSRDFAGAERRVHALQRSINDLQSRHGIYAQRVRTTQALERQGTAGLQRRIALMQQTAANEEMVQQQRINAMKAEAAEHQRLNRLEESRLDPLGAQIAMRQNAKVEAEDARKVALEQERLDAKIAQRKLRFSEMQGLVARRNAMAQLRATEAENRLLRDQQRIQARNLELSQAQEEATMGRLRAIGGVIGAATAITAVLVKAGLPVGAAEQRAGFAAHLTAAQRRGLEPFSTRLAGQVGMFSRNQILEAMPGLFGALGGRRSLAMGLALPFLRTAGIEHALGVPGAPDAQDALREIAQAATAVGAGNAAQYRAINRMLANVVLRTGGNVDLESAAGIMSAIGTSGARLGVLQRGRLGEAVSFLSATTSARGVSGASLANLFQQLLTPAAGRNVALQYMLGPYGLQRALKSGRASDLFGVLERFSAATHGHINLPLAMMGRASIHTLLSLSAMGPGVLRRAFAQTQTDVATQAALAAASTNARASIIRLTRSIETLASVAGRHPAHVAGRAASGLAGFFSGQANYYERHGGIAWWLHLIGMGANPAGLVRGVGHRIGQGWHMGLATAAGDARMLGVLKQTPPMVIHHPPTRERPVGVMKPGQPVVIHHHHTTVHVTTHSDSHVKKLVRGLKSGVLSHGEANPIGVAPQLYGGYAGVG